MDVHFASINNRKTANNRSQFNKLVRLMQLERANNITLCTFSYDNVTNNLSGDLGDHFLNYHKLNIKFKKLNNKKIFRAGQNPKHSF